MVLLTTKIEVVAHCRRHANLRPDKTSDYEAEYGVCLSVTTGGVFGEAGVGVFDEHIERIAIKPNYLSLFKISSQLLAALSAYSYADSAPLFASDASFSA